MGISQLFHLPFSPALLMSEGARLSKAVTRQTDVVFPGHTSQGKLSSRLTVPRGAQLLSLRTRRGHSIKALFSPASRPDRPTFLFFYGNDMCLRAAVPVFELLRQLDINVLVPEYVGFGLSNGRPSETNCYATADAAHDFLLSRPELDPTKIVVGGCSLGGAIAIDLASRRNVAGLATLVTFTSLREMARLFYPGFIVSLVLRWRFQSVQKIRRVRCPILIGHSRTDRFIPFEMADKLASAATSSPSVSRLVLEDMDHNSTTAFAQCTHKILYSLDHFIQSCVPSAAVAAITNAA